MADTLSRAPLISDSLDLQESAETFISSIVEALPTSADHLEQIAKAQLIYPILQQDTRYCKEGWPAKHSICGPLKPYWSVHSELSLHNTLLMCADRIVIPTCLQQDILSRIHQGHQGIVKCRLCAHTSVW